MALFSCLLSQPNFFHRIHSVTFVVVVVVGFLVLVSEVLSEDLHPVGTPSGWDRTERLSCL